jgi:hypothetical protein
VVDDGQPTLPSKETKTVFDKIYRVPPSAVVIVGLDAPFENADKSHALYDERTETVAILVDVWEHPEHGQIERDDYITLSESERDAPNAAAPKRSPAVSQCR